MNQRSSSESARSARLEHLIEISVALNSTRDPDDLLQFIIEHATAILDCEAASILLFDEEGQKLRFAAATGSNPLELAAIPVPLDNSLAGTIYSENRALIINDVASDKRHFRDVGDKVSVETRSLLGVPMRIEDKVTGVLEGINKRSGEFAQDDEETLSIIADQAAIAIRNARQLKFLEKAFEELSKLDELKSNFITIVSHELRTPLNAILGYASLLQDEVDVNTAEMVDIIYDSASRMAAVVEAMTRLELLQRGTVRADLQPIEIDTVVRAALADVEALARSRGHAVSFEPAGPVAEIHGDAVLLGMMIRNLLTNAIHFTPAGGEIDVSVAHSNGEIRISVRDSGIGIPEGELEKVFDPYYQIADLFTRSQDGLGLGLTLARSIAALHGGTIRATSPGEGQGTTMRVRLTPI